VDYYNYGTCEISGGSYFCGDHSCNTYKYVGANSDSPHQHYVREQKMIEPALYAPSSRTNSPFSTSDAYLYSAGTGNANGANDPSNHPPLEMNAFVQGEQLPPKNGAWKDEYVGKEGGRMDPSGYPLRMDAQTPQYHLYDGVKLPLSHIGLFEAIRDDGVLWEDTDVVQWHTKGTMLAGQCKSKCDNDDTCKAFQENRYGYLHATIKCTTFHFPGWLSEYPQLSSAMTKTTSWDVYVKYTVAKAQTWLHVPKSTAFSPTTSGRRLDGVY